MSSFLLSIGSASVRLLPDVFTALCCGASGTVGKLDVFSLLGSRDNCDEAASLAENYSRCSRFFSGIPEGMLFPAEISFSSCSPVFRSVRDLYADPDTSLLIAALRGKGLPLSFQTDPEAVEWCFSDLLDHPEEESIQPFLSWLSGINENTDGSPARLTILADLCDSFSAGVTLVLLHDLRSRLKGRKVFISLIGLAELVHGDQEPSFRCLRSTLQAMADRSAFGVTDDGILSCADALWLLSMPSSMVESSESYRLLALSAARILSDVFSSEDLPSPGLHVRETDGTVSFSSLESQGPAFVAFLRFSVWMISDIFPSLRIYLSHPARLRSLAPNPRNTVFRQLFPNGYSTAGLTQSLDSLEDALKSILSGILRFMRSVPSPMRLTAENTALWQQAVNACGRYITVASEYDVSSAEAHESGLDAVRPVHRDSMADTDEEQLHRRLLEMKQQLESEETGRSGILSSLGGYRALQVRLDCLNRCRSALNDTESKAAALPESTERITVLKLERRIRLLRAAVSRCEAELKPETVLQSVSSRPETHMNPEDPYSGTLFQPEACHALEKLLGGTMDNSLHVHPLIPDIPEPDPKARVKALLAACKNADGSVQPLAVLAETAYAICLEELKGIRFLSRGIMPPLPLLPDLVPAAPPVRIEDVLELLPDTKKTDDVTSEMRGLLAMLLLRQYRRRSSGEASLEIRSCLPGNSAVLRYWLGSRQAEKVHILSLKQEDDSRPFALILPGLALIPAKRTGMHSALIPAFSTWFDKESGCFSDPCENLGEGDKALFLKLISSYQEKLPEDVRTPLRSFLHDFHQDLSRERPPFRDDTDFQTRLCSVCGLRSIPAYASGLTVMSGFYEKKLPSDLIGGCLTGLEDFPAADCDGIPEETLYLYRDIPFAREDSAMLLDSPHASGEDYTLRRLASECAVLSEYSDDYRDALLKNIPLFLSRCADALPEIRSTAMKIMEQAGKPTDRNEPVFTWPWDPKSPSLLTVLRESLGEVFSPAALSPFSDRLALFPARGTDVIGDAFFSSMCSILPVIREDAAPDSSDICPDAVLPPFSGEFGYALCMLPEGRTLLKPGLLGFEREEESIVVTLTLDGAFPVHLIRKYAPEEILHLYTHDIPSVAVWPSIPFRKEDWHTYYVYAHLPKPYSVSVLPDGGTFSGLRNTGEDRYTAVLSSFPVCVSLEYDGMTAGLLPNLLPPPIINASDPVEICVDFGSAGTSVIFSSGKQRKPMQGPVMVRTLINNPSSTADLLRREFIPAVPVSALLPTVSRIFRNVPGTSPVPFMDGIILMSSDLEDLLSTSSDAVYTSLKWEEEKGRSGALCLHQLLLIAALEARAGGASAVSWRFSLPDEMAKEGREFLMNLFLSLCGKVHQESGYPVPQEGLPVAFASESSALGAYFRYCAADDTRGGFMTLDLGACTADISLFLRGREQAVRTCQLPLGVHYILLPSLLRDPDLPAREFGFCTDENFRHDLSLFCKALRAAKSDPVSLRRARAALDYFISDHLPVLISCMLQLASAGSPSRTGALMLLYFSYLLMLSGLILYQLSSDPNKNDFLPEQMTLCLSGRGSILMESLPPQVKNSLWHFLSMFRNRRVSSLSLLFSAEKKMEIPVGLSLLQEVYSAMPPASVIPASLSVRPSVLLPEFLMRFRREFPASAALLFPGFFTNDYYHPFSARGEALIAASIDQSFPPADVPRPFDSLSAWIGNLLDSITVN